MSECTCTEHQIKYDDGEWSRELEIHRDPACPIHHAPNLPKSGCRCRNHRGTAKQQHKTRQAAELAALRLVGHSGRAEVYQCPTSDRWHVTTRRAA